MPHSELFLTAEFSIGFVIKDKLYFSLLESNSIIGIIKQEIILYNSFVKVNYYSQRHSLYIHSARIFFIYQQSKMKNNKTVAAFKNSQKMQPLFSQNGSQSSSPLTFDDSLTAVPKHPFCTFGVLSAKGERGKENSVAFVVEDNYLLTCASNCYSHKHGLSSSMTFTINSNRKSGYDTYKISKVFVPEQYKANIKSKRNEFNYALLYIEGEPKLRDKYGSIGINFQGSNEKPFTYFKLVTNNQGQMLSFGEFRLEQDIPIPMGGGPLLFENSSYIKEAAGLVFVEANNSPPCFMLFNKKMYSQLAQWVQVQKGQLCFPDNVSNNQVNMSVLKDEDRRPLQKVYLGNYNLNGKASSFFEGLPCTTISKINLARNEINEDLSFLKQKKFRELKCLSLQNNNIGPKGCQIIASFFLNNLRQLCLNENPILDEGCKHLSTAKWPFLANIKLSNCRISNGLHFLMQQPRLNLHQLEIGQNNFQNNLTKSLQKVQLPRIKCLNMSNAIIIARDLAFLRSPSWKSLIQLILNGTHIGKKGCKMIKQAEIPLKKLHLTSCRITSLGIKWLCKANLRDMQIFEINNSTMDSQGYLALSRVAFLKLQKIEMSITHGGQFYMDYIPKSNINVHRKRYPAIKLLFKSQWFDRVVGQPIAKRQARLNQRWM